MNKIVLSCEKLSKTYQDGKSRIDVLKNIDFHVEVGRSVAIVGSSGSGKSTLLHLLGGLDLPSTGKVTWSAQPIVDLSEAKRCQLRNQHLGFVYQFHHLLPEFDALENVMMPLLIREVQTDMAREKAASVLSKVGLAKRVSHKISQLSGGERQRVAIARALVGEPACVLADEPTGNLDQKTAEEVLQVMLELQKSAGVSFVVVTHDERLASKLQTCYALANGVLKQESS